MYVLEGWHEKEYVDSSRADRELMLLAEETVRNILEKMDEQFCTGDFH